MKTFALTLSVLVLAVIAQETYGRPGGFRHRARRSNSDGMSSSDSMSNGMSSSDSNGMSNDLDDPKTCNSLTFVNGTSVDCGTPCASPLTCVAYGSPSPLLPEVLAGAFREVSLCVEDCLNGIMCKTGFTCTNGRCWPESEGPSSAEGDIIENCQVVAPVQRIP